MPSFLSFVANLVDPDLKPRREVKHARTIFDLGDDAFLEEIRALIAEARAPIDVLNAYGTLFDRKVADLQSQRDIVRLAVETAQGHSPVIEGSYTVTASVRTHASRATVGSAPAVLTFDEALAAHREANRDRPTLAVTSPGAAPVRSQSSATASRG